MLVADKKTIEVYYQALLDRTPSFVGVFYVAVKTTSIFCIATCRARKPKLENVEFFTTFKEPLAAGYRPCKVCKPTENAYEAPDAVRSAIELVKANPKEKISDDQLLQHDIRPERVRRWFNQHYGMTFHAFQRMYRINQAFEELKKGETSTKTAFDAGYDSLSGFAYTYKKILGKSPSGSIFDTVILIDRFTTPLGPMFVCASDQGVCLLEFVDRKMLETEFRDLQKLLSAKIIAGENEHIKQAKSEMAEYFSGRRKTFDVKLHTPGTEFQNLVWSCLQTVPYGQTASYQKQAEKIGKPSAVRAVASANGGNRISIIVPCHRVVGKNGQLTGYGGGIERKRWLLDHEHQYSAT